MKITSIEFQTIVSRYESGERSIDLATEYGVNRRSLDERLRNAGVANHRDKMEQLTKDQIADAIARYRSGEPRSEIAQSLEFTRQTLDRLFKSHNVEDRSVDWTLNHNAFDELTEEAAYWVGFLLADGCIYYPSNGSPRIQLGLKHSDKRHVEKFKAFLNSSNKVYTHIDIEKRAAKAEINIVSEKLITKLAEYGVVPRKTFTATVSPILTPNRHFWRGMVDGDGYITPAGKIRVGLCGTYDVIQSFYAWVNTFSKTDAKGFGSTNIWRAMLECKLARETIKELYSDATIYLDRKYYLAQSVMKQPSLE